MHIGYGQQCYELSLQRPTYTHRDFQREVHRIPPGAQRTPSEILLFVLTQSRSIQKK